jgi:hypothetical protein
LKKKKKKLTTRKYLRRFGHYRVTNEEVKLFLNFAKKEREETLKLFKKAVNDE